MAEKEFNLIDEAWIPVTRSDGTYAEIGLKELFGSAHEIRSLSGEIATQDASVMRFLLATGYAVVLRETIKGESRELEDSDDAIERWRSYWERGRFDGKLFGDYLERWRDKFWLFEPERPFYQCNIERGTSYDAKKLIGDLAESGNKIQMFSYLSRESKRSVSYGMAARWLLNLMAYDDASLKPTNKRSDGTKMDSAKVGWLGRIGLTYVVGNNLFETLMLNMALTDRSGELFADGKPTWEKESVSSEERVPVPIPDNPFDLLTVQSRRVKLIRENGEVTGYIETVGDQFPDGCQNIEMMSAWKQSKEGEMKPLKHLEFRKSVWNDYASLVMRSEGSWRPGVIEWCNALKDRGIIGNTYLNIAVTGVSYLGGAIPSGIDDVFHDSISVNSNLLSKIGEGWNIRISEAVGKTDSCMKDYKLFIKDILILSGIAEGNDDAINSQIESRTAEVYRSLDLPFRKWLHSIDPEKSDMDEKSTEWYGILRSVLIRSAEDDLAYVNPRSYVGICGYEEKKIVKKVKSEFKTSTVFHFKMFVSRMYKTLPKERSEETE